MGDTVYIASCSGRIFALDTRTGEQLWSHDANSDGGRATFHGDPLIAGETLVYPADTGVVYAFDGETGDLHWKTRLPSMGVFSDAVAAGSIVLTANDKSGELYALDLETGEQRWTFAPPGERRGMNAAAPVTYGQTVLYGGPDGVLYALEAESGEVTWKLDLEDAFGTELALAEDLLVVGTETNRLLAIDVSERVVVSEVGLPGSPDGTPVVTDEMVIVLALPDWLVAVEPATGEIHWTAPGTWSSEKPLVDGDLLVAGTWDGELVGLSLADGTVVWSARVGGGVRGLGKERDRDTYFVGAVAGTIYAIRPATASQKKTEAEEER